MDGLFAIAAIGLVVMMAAIGGYVDGRDEVREQAIEHGVAFYHPQTRAFTLRECE